HSMNMSVIRNYTISDADFKSRYEVDDADTEEIEKYNNLERITSLGIKFWDGLYKYNLKTRILTPYQETNVSMIRKTLKESGMMNDRLIKKGVKIVNYALEQGLDFDKIAAVSK